MFHHFRIFRVDFHFGADLGAPICKVKTMKSIVPKCFKIYFHNIAPAVSAQAQFLATIKYSISESCFASSSVSFLSRVLTVGDMLVIRDDRLDLRSASDDHSLILRGVSSADGGDYSCEIEADAEYPIVITHRVEVLGECSAT